MFLQLSQVPYPQWVGPTQASHLLQEFPNSPQVLYTQAIQDNNHHTRDNSPHILDNHLILDSTHLTQVRQSQEVLSLVPIQVIAVEPLQVSLKEVLLSLQLQILINNTKRKVEMCGEDLTSSSAKVTQ